MKTHILPNRRINSREQTLLGLIGVLIFTWIVYNFIMVPVKEEIQNLNQSLLTRQVKLIKYKKALQQKEIITKQLEHFLPQFEQSMSTANPLPKVIENLQNELHLSKSTLTPKESENVYQFTKNEIDVEIDESFENLITFIFQLKNQPERVNLNTLRIVANEGNQDKLKSFMTLVQYVPNKESKISHELYGVRNFCIEKYHEY